MIKTLNDYQEQAAVTLAPDQADGSLQSLAWLTLGLVGESGEVAEYVKKVGIHGKPYDRANMVKELGDSLWYIAMVAKNRGISMQEIADANIEKLQKVRYKEGKFDKAASNNREEEEATEKKLAESKESK